MGMAQDYVCTSCGYRADNVTEDFDCGMDGDITTPVVCPEHGIEQVETGLNRYQEGWRRAVRSEYPCPHCKRDSPLWDRKMCPKCGNETLAPDPFGADILWD